MEHDIYFVLRLINVLDFGSDVSSFSVSCAVTDNSGLSAYATYKVLINEENKAPESSIAGSVIFKISENSQGGSVVGNLVQNKHFFDEDNGNFPI